MDSDLALYIKSGQLISKNTTVWGEDIRLDIACYLGTMEPPAEYVSSVRATVFRNDEVLVVRGPNGYHVIPGGRIEKGEIHEKTLRREILEEAGWSLSKLFLLGFMHFHHKSPKPANYNYPYPDFLWLLYIAETDKNMPEARVQGKWELEVGFYPTEKAKLLPMENGQLELLEAAINTRHKISTKN